MRADGLRPGNVTAAAVLLGGVLMAALPHFTATIVQLVVLTGAVSWAVHALASNVPPAGWISAFQWRSPFSASAQTPPAGHRSDALERFRARFGMRRQRLEGALALPPALLRQLRPLIAATLGVELDDRARIRELRGLSPVTLAILRSTPLERSTWLRTVRPDETGVAETVHHVLDDLDRIRGVPFEGRTA